jgi:carbon monoxide dehydrogenase subunit G
MELNHSFTVDLDPQETFDLLLDVPRIAHCMPGATLTSAEGDDFAGTVKVKFGPVVMTYSGKAQVIERDEGNLRAKIALSGRDTKGTSDASATVNTVLVATSDGTEVRLLTDLAVTGKPAQLGRGLMNDVGRKLIGQFASALAEDIEATKNPPAAEPTPETQVGATVSSSDSVGGSQSSASRTANNSDAIDLLEVAGLPDKRLLAAGAAVVALLILLVRRARLS